MRKIRIFAVSQNPVWLVFALSFYGVLLLVMIQSWSFGIGRAEAQESDKLDLESVMDLDDAAQKLRENPANPFSVSEFSRALVTEKGKGLRRVITLSEAYLISGVVPIRRLDADIRLYVFAERDIDGTWYLAVGMQPDHAEGWVRKISTVELTATENPAEHSYTVVGLGEPLVAENSGFFRRVLTRPGASLRTSRGSRLPLDTFSILYVFADRHISGKQWLAVGERLDKVDGWVELDFVEEWKSMLVMQYAPKSTERQRTLFFRTKEALKSVIDDPNGKRVATTLYESVATGGNADGRVVAVEPDRAVRADQLYLLPILNHEKTFFNYQNWRDVTLLQLAGVTDQSFVRNSSTAGLSLNKDSDHQNERLRDFVIRVAFVIDTTKSMGPYIEATKTFVRNVYQRLESVDAAGNLQIALIGFRDNIEKAPGADYVTRVYRSFELSAKPEDVIAAIDEVQPATNSTHQWREDAYAGIHRAITELDWALENTDRPSGANIMVLITDASARDIGDELASVPNFGAPTARAQLDNRGIALHAFHLQTTDARDSTPGEIERGASQYREIDNLYSVRGDTPRAISESFSDIEDSLVTALTAYSKGIELRRAISIYDQINDIDIDIDSDSNVIDEGNTGIASTRILSDIFRFQQEYLGYFEGTRPPAFYRAWVADRDLFKQRQASMVVSVLISRSQLELLASSIESLLDDLDSKRATYSETYEGTRDESGRASADPLLPEATAEMLASLPYYSKLLRETAEGFAALGPSQDVLLNEVRAKLTAYRSILKSQRKWIRASENAPKIDELYPLPLDDLP